MSQGMVNLVIDLIIVSGGFALLFYTISLESKLNKFQETVENWTVHMADEIAKLSDRMDTDPVLDREQIEAKTREEMERVADKVMTEWTQNIISYNPYGK